MTSRRRSHRGVPTDAAGASDVGPRAENQDRWAVDAAAGWAVVCDGVGGHAGGAVAATLARDAAVAVLSARGAGRRPVRQRIASESASDARRTVRQRIGSESPSDALLRAAGAANAAVLAGREADPARADMLTTLTAAVRVDKRRWAVLQVGDSPAWALGPGGDRSVTFDHNLVGDLVRAGALTAEQAVGHRGRHVITRAVGLAPTVDPEVFTVDLGPGDALVLASDGLSDVADPAAAAPVVAAAPDAEAAAHALVALALARGTGDNVTVVVLR